MADSTHDTDSGQVAADLRAAADVLERDGWAQGGLARRGHCVVEAIAEVTLSRLRSASVARAVLREQLAVSSRDGLTRWNDTPGRTAAEVIAALRAAADRAEAQQ